VIGSGLNDWKTIHERGHVRNEPSALKRRLSIVAESLTLEPAGGIETSTLQECLALAHRGHHVSVAFGADGSLRNRFEDAGIDLYGPVSFDLDVKHPLRDALTFVESAKWVRAQRPDVLWLNRFEHIHWALESGLIANCPVVCHLHNLPPALGTSILRNRVAKYVAVSEFMKSSWSRAGIDEDRITVIPNCVPTDQYPLGGLTELTEARRILGLPASRKVVLYFGRMVREKGIETLLEAFVNLRAANDDVLLVLLGSPSPFEIEPISKWLDVLGTDFVRWFPVQEDVVPFLHAADVVVFPTWMEEGFGRVVIEGMKTGRPVIASRIGAIPEILTGDMARFLVEPRNVEELRERIDTTLNWRVVEPGLAEACSSWVLDNFPFELMIDAFEATLKKVTR
jgi:glycosyltransferase involved in cell wall biosynthesis